MRFVVACIYLALSSIAALAQSPILAYDVTPPDQQCTAGMLRPCYWPLVNTWSPVNPHVGGPDVTHAFASFTLASDQAHLCPQMRAGLTNDNGNQPVISLSLTSRAICLINLSAGAHTVYAMEYARANTQAFRGSENQALIVRFW